MGVVYGQRHKVLQRRDVFAAIITFTQVNDSTTGPNAPRFGARDPSAESVIGGAQPEYALARNYN